jgi:uncharacterized protein (DUF2267 family)
MTMTGLDAFDRAIHKANDWLQDIMYELNWQDRHRAYLALRATLHALRDRLSLEEAVHLGAQLPMLVRGFYYDGWTLTGKPVKERRKEEFLAHIKAAFHDGDIDAEQVVRAIFKLLAHRVSQGEIKDIKQILPKELAELWPHPPGKVRE